MCELEAKYEAYRKQTQAKIESLESWIARVLRECEMDRPFLCYDCDCRKRKFKGT